ncbi:MAG: amino acid permease, partial [Solirubrobacterales bacterium]|nr:amino acid permease [Solirubrobacterales bacterium]
VAVCARGVPFVTKLASKGTVIGTLIPGAILVVMGIIFLGEGHHSAAPMTAAHLLPAWTGLAGIVLIVSNFLAYAGMEMNAVHVDELRNPATEFPKATWVAMVLVLAVFILPALAISWVIPAQQIGLTSGVMQAFAAFFTVFGIQFMVPLTAVAICVAMISGVFAWLSGPSKGLLLVGRQYGYLPPYLQKMKTNGVPMHILYLVAAITTLLGIGYAFIPSVSSAYWIFAVVTTQIYLIMYVLMFIAGVNLRRRQPDHPRGYRAPGFMFWSWVGGLSSVLAILIGFVPPSQFGHSSPVVFALINLAGIVLLGILPPLLFYKYRKPSWKLEDADGQPSASATGAVASGANGQAPAPGNGQASAPAAKTPATQAPATKLGTAKIPAAKVPAATAAAHANGPSPEAPHFLEKRRHRNEQWAIGALVVLIAALAVVIFKPGKNTHTAQAKATQLEALFAAHHLPVPVDRHSLIAVLGSNGGSVCSSPAGALNVALKDQQFYNGAAGEGARPIRASARIVEGEELVLQVYCPSKLAAFERYANGNGYYTVVRR